MGAGRPFSRRALLRGATAAGAAYALGQVAACTSSDGADPPADPVDGPPNVIVILADDMRHDEAVHMPNLTRRLVDEGVSFTGARQNISLCSPARAGFLTGQYSTRHRVRSQSDAFGRLNDETQTIAVWMQGAGYDTGLVGKYFTAGARQRAVPGWRFQRVLTTGNQQQYGYTVWDGERATEPEADQTAYLRTEVLDFVAGAEEPFFLWFTPTANHFPLEAPPGHEDDVESLAWPDAREDDVTDKPPWIRALPALTDAQQEEVQATQRARIRELLGLDDTIGALCATLDDTDRMGNTVIVFSSDNGVFAGEHRLPLLSKNMPYEPSTRVPCVVRAPGLAPATVAQPAHMLIDLTATCVAVADARPDLALDGVSLLDLAAHPERYDDRRLLYDRDDRDDGPDVTIPAASGVFTADRKLVRYETSPPTYELYDLAGDPDELDNLADDPAHAAERAALEADLDALLADGA